MSMATSFRTNGPGAADLRSAAGSQDESDPEAIKGKFDHAINKVKNAPKKAQKKIPPETVPNLERDKMNSVRSTENARREEQQAQQMMDSDPHAAEIAKGGGSQDLISKLSANFGGAGGPQGPGGMSAIAGAGAGGKMNGLSRIRDMNGGGDNPFSNIRKGSFGNVGSPAGIDDVGQLMGMFKGAQGQAGEMRGGIAGMSGQQNQLMELGGQQQQRVDGLGSLKDMFGSKMEAHGAKEKAFGEAGKGLHSAAKGLNTAAQVMGSVSQMLNGVAAAVAPIPFVGPALSAAMKKAAKVVSVVGKVLKMAGQACKKSGNEMKKDSAKEGGLKDMNQVKKVDTEAKQKMTMDQLNRTQQRLDKASDAKRDTQAELEQNQQQQQQIASRLNELGMPVAAPQGGGNEGGDERPQVANGIKSGRGQRRPAPSPAPAGGAPSSVAPASGSKAGSPVPAAAGGQGPKGVAAPATGGGKADPVGQVEAPGQPAQAGQANAVGGPKNGKKGESKEEANQAAAVGQPGRVNPMGRNRNQQKPGERKSKIGGPGAATGGGAAGGSSKRDRFESELNRLSSDINDSKKGGNKQANGLRDKQRQLSLVYNQAAQENVAVKEDIERAASQALADSPERPTRKLRTVQGNEALASAEGGPQGERDERRQGALRPLGARGGLRPTPGLGGLGGLNVGNNPLAGQSPTQVVHQVQPVQQVAV